MDFLIKIVVGGDRRGERSVAISLVMVFLADGHAELAMTNIARAKLSQPDFAKGFLSMYIN